MSWTSDGVTSTEPPSHVLAVRDSHDDIADRINTVCGYCGPPGTKWRWRHNGNTDCWFEMDGIGPWTQVVIGEDDPVASLIFTTVTEAKRLAVELNDKVGSTESQFSVDRVYLAKVQFALGAAAELLAKLYEEKKQITDKLEVAGRNHDKEV